jgi:hypothetical protein
VASDVLYYEPHVREAWSVLLSQIAPGGTLIIRVPNKLPLMRATLALRGGQGEMDRMLPFFNPEHCLILSRKYLVRRLARSGFSRTQSIPSQLLTGHVMRIVGKTCFSVATMISAVTKGRVIVSPAMLLVARGYRPS